MFSMRLHESTPLYRRHAKARPIGGLNRRAPRPPHDVRGSVDEACKSTKSYIQNETGTPRETAETIISYRFRRSSGRRRRGSRARARTGGAGGPGRRRGAPGRPGGSTDENRIKFSIQPVYSPGCGYRGYVPVRPDACLVAWLESLLSHLTTLRSSVARCTLLFS